MNAFLDIYLARNLGDDLFLKIIADRFPNINFIVNYYGNAYHSVSKAHNNITIPKYSAYFRILNRLKIYDYISDVNRICRETDLCVFLGGSIFREEEYWRPLFQWRKKLIEQFKSQGKPVFIIGANFGPAYSDEFVQMYRDLFAKCDDICFRDENSYLLFKDLKQVRYEKDIVFQLDVPSKSVRQKLVSVSVIDPAHIPNLTRYAKEYIDWIAKGAASLLQEGYKVQLVGFCESEGDKRICEAIQNKIRSYVNGRKTEVVMYEGNIDKILQQLSNSELIVASRFHANVLAIKMQTKLVPLVYSEKTTNVLNDLHFNGEIIPIECMCQYNLDELVHRCPDGKCESINMNELSKSAERQFYRMEEYLELKK